MMPRHAPRFWHQPHHPLRYLLTPLSWLYRLAKWLRWKGTTPFTADIPVICVGNLVAGGAGKTPVVIALTKQLMDIDYTPHIISRGYGGTTSDTTRVLPTHTAAEVGDEPLMLSQHAPCWIGKHRPSSAIAAQKAGADIIIMDDGFQNPTLHKDASLIVIDGGYGLGNEAVMPAGALRETLQSGCKRADAALIIGEDRTNIQALLPPHILQLRGRITPTLADDIKNTPLLAFCGIGRPQKFYDTLQNSGLDIIATQDFPDHHPFTEDELQALFEQAAQSKAILITTEKDWMRLTPSWQAKIHYLPIMLAITPNHAFMEFLKR